MADLFSKEQLDILIIIVSVLIPFIYKVIKVMFNLVKKIKNAIEIIEKEFKPNGGTSIKDAISRIDDRQKIQSQRDKIIITHLRAAIFETDKYGKCIWVNKQYTRLLRRTFYEIINDNWTSHLTENDIIRVKDILEKHHNTKDPFSFECIFETPDKQKISVSCDISALLNNKNEIVGYIGVLNELNV